MEEKQKIKWDKCWESLDKGNYQGIINSQFTKEAYSRIKSFIDENAKLILEAGCGTGRFCLLLAKDFPNAEVVGIDVSDTAISIARNAKTGLGVKNVKFENRDLFSTNYPDNSFDVVFNEGVIEHFSLNGYPTYKDALCEMVRITKMGGKVIVAVPNWYCFPHTFYKWLLTHLNKEYEYGYEKSFKHQELIKLFNEVGLYEIKLSAWYPAHGLCRLGKYSIIFSLMGIAVDMIQFRPFIRKFGFEILIKGIK
jgi:ubiquinone/menaquinone biosynthesis C-methylase UbiE